MVTVKVDNKMFVFFFKGMYYVVYKISTFLIAFYFTEEKSHNQNKFKNTFLH